MKDGDIFLQRLEEAAQRAKFARRLMLAFSGLEYAPDWMYWLDFGKAVRN